ncbi:Kinesin-like protein [Seminavis robusta]|uniref:Kinesin-like protein n=1 Tax=Seminavis robusta TaxID=568900 RepID=A0A9N8DP09_9STRA|nr:Kinesin-like protein [Seminavis robusta]|eukprot:Sro246_g097600.1 Kinesin-like protein (875) ;mRNA; r:9228-11852
MENEEESNNRGPFQYPYSSSYGFAASSWDLRRNLTETFNQHVGASEAQKTRSKADNDTKAPPSSGGKGIDQSKNNADQSTTRLATKKSDAASGKPPMQPSHLRSMGDTAARQLAVAEGANRRVSVFLRVRPPKQGAVNTIDILPGDPSTKVRTHAPRNSNVAKMNRESNSSKGLPSDSQMAAREYDFQQVFGPEKKNEDLYTTVVAPMVDKMFPRDENREPESGLLFAYGATNAGKTYSILGEMPSSHGKPINEMHCGIVPRAIQGVLDNINHLKSKEQGLSFVDLYVSVLEIHNENIYDLLEQQQNIRHPAYIREPLKLRENQKHTFVRGLVKHAVNDVKEGLQLVKQANSKRHTASNNLNSDSSRSHCIFQLQIIKRSANIPKMRQASSLTSNNGYSTDEEASRISKQKPITLWIVDLAGSERSKRTNVGTLRQKEASLINKSLTTLMRCLSIIRENQSSTGSSQVIPFRDSKLTHLFMPVLTGRTSSSISMIVNVNPAAPDYDETNHVLSYASKAKMVEIKEFKMPADRPVKKASAVSKVSKLMKRLSPKKLMKRPGGSKDAERKRKAAPGPARIASFNAPSSTNSNSSKDAHKTKKLRGVKPGAACNPPREAVSKLAPGPANENAMKSLQMALSIANAEVENLKFENSRLTEELGQVEGRVRLEVSAEMDEQLDQTKQYYLEIIEKMKGQSRQSVGVFEKRRREENASEQIDTLLFKVEEAEEEMNRQAKAHTEELATKQREIDELRASLVEMAALKATGDDNEDVEDVVQAQRRKIREQAEELMALEKSKTDLIEAYEKLLAGEDDDEDETGSDEGDNDNEEDVPGDDDSDDNTDEVHPKYMTRNRFAQQKGTNPRAPLSSISANVGIP